MRICSLVPGATEVLFALGLGDQVAGVTHECDWPPEAADRPRVTASLLQGGDLSSPEIDEAVARAAADGKALYAIDAEVWAKIEADIVVAQELCEVCAVSRSEVDAVSKATKLDVGVLDYSPATLEDVFDQVATLGSWLGAEAAAAELVAGMRARVDRVKAALAGVESTPRVFVSEWIEPPYAAGHWVPEMVSLAGGMEVAGLAGEPSHRMRWADVAALDPDVVVLAPCGFDLDRTLEEVVTLDVSAHLLGTSARRESRVFAVDANGYFSRPGPRLVDGIELLAYLLHPDRYSDPGIPWSRVRT
ncbi:MAG TPA: ABC transporter substrate-binding protein [Gaiellaceae bacterium]|nr:ABC transporter substrate-binding protein [Gaiellaceae bacterium]